MSKITFEFYKNSSENVHGEYPDLSEEEMNKVNAELNFLLKITSFAPDTVEKQYFIGEELSRRLYAMGICVYFRSFLDGEHG